MEYLVQLTIVGLCGGGLARVSVELFQKIVMVMLMCMVVDAGGGGCGSVRSYGVPGIA